MAIATEGLKKWIGIIPRVLLCVNKVMDLKFYIATKTVNTLPIVALKDF